MKKFLLVMMAVCLTFAMISCGDDPAPTPPATTEKVTITQDFNWPADATGTEPDAVTFQINKGGPIGDVAGATEAQSPTNYVFVNWSTTAASNTSLVPTATYSTDDTIYAWWAKKAAAGQAVISFNTYGGTAVGDVTITLTADGEGYTAAVIPEASRPANPTRENFTFDGWFEASSGGTAVNLTTKTFAAGNHTLHAQWTAGAPAPVTITFAANYAGASPATIKTVTLTSGAALAATDWPANPTRAGGNYFFRFWGAANNATAKVDANATYSTDATIHAIWTGNIDFTGAEKVYLENGGYAIYKFELPDGKKWSDYKEITADFMADDDNYGKQIRGFRLMGNYLVGDFTEDDNGAFVAKYLTSGNMAANNKNGPYIWHNGASWTNNWATAANISAAWQWSTATYPLGASNYNDHEATVDNDATGPFYFGVGLTGSGDSKNAASLNNGIVQWIRNVTLVGYDEDDNVVSTGGGFDGPAFCSYIDPVTFCWRGEATATVVIPSKPPEEEPDAEPVEHPGAGNYVLAEATGGGFILDGDTGFTWINNANQMGWYSKGWTEEGEDGEEDLVITTGLELNQIVWAKYLVLETARKPASRVELVWQGDANMGWNSKSVTTGWDGTPDPAVGAMEVTGDVASGFVTKIDLTKGLAQYASFKVCQEQVKILIDYTGGHLSGGDTGYATAWEQLGIKKAYLIVEEEE